MIRVGLLGDGRDLPLFWHAFESMEAPVPIATWSTTLEDCFDGLVTLTDVTGSKRRSADIVVHFVPTAGGVVFGGYAICGDHGCPNILVRSDLPPSLDGNPTTPSTSVG